MPLKSAQVMSADVAAFLARAREALKTTEAFQRRLAEDAEFAALWERDSAAALRAAGIDPEARQEVGFGPYAEGAQCNWCITPNGNSCHC
jgi:hypothetical protein